MSTAATIAQQSLTLSYSDVQEANPKWPEHMVQDYLFKQQNINTIAENNDINQEQVDQNTTDIAVNAAAITVNAGNISDNTTDIATNATNIGINATGISANATNITTNTTNIGVNTTNLTIHEALTDAHGVTGINIGTEDYAQTLTGGAVLLAVKIADATQTSVAIVTADVGVAPVAYDQTYAQEQTDLINENKATINNLVTDMANLITQFNALLLAEQNAKQMNAV